MAESTLELEQQQAAWARQLATDQVQRASQARAAEQRRARQAVPAAAQAAESLLGTVNQAAAAKPWQTAHEIVEGLGFQFFMLAAILAAVPAAGLFLVRYFFGNVQHRVPAMGPAELVYRSSKVIFILFVAGIEVLLILAIGYFMKNPIGAFLNLLKGVVGGS